MENSKAYKLLIDQINATGLKKWMDTIPESWKKYMKRKEMM